METLKILLLGASLLAGMAIAAIVFSALMSVTGGAGAAIRVGILLCVAYGAGRALRSL